MYVRLELCTRPGWSDPQADTLTGLMQRMKPELARKIRWARILRVFWMDLQAQRDQAVAAIQSGFGDLVLTWAFTGDLVPSAAGATGSLQDLMQASPHRPGVFYGIEKRIRLDRLDSESTWALETIQVALGRKNIEDRVSSGALLLLEGNELDNSDLEWIAKHAFAAASSESWTIFTEEELKRNARFQSDQVAKYINPSALTVSERWLQRAKTRLWVQKESVPAAAFTAFERTTADHHSDEEWINRQIPKAWIRPNNQRGMCVLDFDEQQLLVGGLECDRELKICEFGRVAIRASGKSHGVQIEGISLSTRTKMNEHTEWNLLENAQLCDEFAKQWDVPVIWSSDHVTEEPESLSVINWVGTLDREKNGHFFDFEPIGVDGRLWFIGPAEEKRNLSRDLLSLERLDRLQREFQIKNEVLGVFPVTDTTLKNALAEILPIIQGASIHLKGSIPEAQKFWEQTQLDGFIWIIQRGSEEKIQKLLGDFGISFLDLGETDSTGGLHLLHEGKVVLEIPEIENILSNPVLPASNGAPIHRVHESRRRRLFAGQALLMNTQSHPLSNEAPVVIRPSLSKTTGVLFSGGFCENAESLKYTVRRALAGGAQFGTEDSVFGLQIVDEGWSTDDWKEMSQWLIELGIPVLNYIKKFSKRQPGGRGYVQVIGKVTDIRNCRLEETKQSGMNLYWFGWKNDTSGAFDEKRTYSWLGSTDGRLQMSLQGCVAYKKNTLNETLVRALSASQMGADINIPEDLGEGFFTLISDADRFPLEEEWRTFNISYANLGRTNSSSPSVLIRTPGKEAQIVSTLDWLKNWKEGQVT